MDDNIVNLNKDIDYLKGCLEDKIKEIDKLKLTQTKLIQKNGKLKEINEQLIYVLYVIVEHL